MAACLTHSPSPSPLPRRGTCTATLTHSLPSLQTWDVYGDTDGMAAGYPGLKRLLSFLASETNKSTGIMNSQALFGDWCVA